MEVSLRELKSNLAAVVRRVKAGESALVTSHRKPVARLVPVHAPEAGASVTDRLLAAGVISERPRPGGLAPWEPNPLPPGVAPLSDAVIEDRG